MRWRIGSYTVKYNPKTNDKSWSASEGTTMTINGGISNPNLIYNGTQGFSIEIFDKPTYISKTPNISKSYLSLTEDRYSDKFYLLNSDGTFDISYKNGSNRLTKTIASGSVTIPTSYPISIVHADMSGLAFWYSESGQSILLITDENGVANRKYIYDSTLGISGAKAITWNFGNELYAIHPNGKIYMININTGVQSFLFEFGDFESNKASGKNRYTDIIAYRKSNEIFIGVLRDKKDIVFIDNMLEVIGMSETGLSNIENISYGDYSDEFYISHRGSVVRLYPNTCRLDLKIIEDIISNGQVTIYDEVGFPSVITVRDIKIARNRNMNEAKYEVQFSADIMYSNQSFDNKWQKYSRGV